VGGLTLLRVVDFRGVFLGCAAACAVAAVSLLVSPSRRAVPVEAAGGLARRLRPMLLAVVVTMTAESAIALLLLLHLQRGFVLEVIEIAWVFLPGAIVMGLVPETLHRFVVRFGRSRVLAGASVASAAFALSLAWAPNPYWIAGLWVLSGVAWAAVIPIQQAVVAEASGTRVGRGMGLYEAAVLVGGLIGSLAAGVLYDAGSWTLACVIAAVVILAGALVVPRAVRTMGVIEFPPPAPPKDKRAPSVAVAEQRQVTERAAPTPRDRGTSLRALSRHAALYVAAQVALAAFGLSALLGHDAGDGLESVLHGAGRVWTVIIVIDVIWTAATATSARRRL
jgi:MFS transporter, DHA1 family, multidrug resistance protein